MKAAGLVNAQGKVQDTLRKALKDGTLTLPEPFAAQLPQVTEILRKLAGRLEIKNADERKQVRAARPCCKARTSRRCGTASSTRPPTA